MHGTPRPDTININSDEIVNRIQYCIRVLGLQIFKDFNVKLISLDEYYNDFTYKNRIEYILYIKNFIYNILKSTQKEIKNLNLTSKHLDKILLYTPNKKIAILVIDSGVNKSIKNLLTKSYCEHSSHNAKNIIRRRKNKKLDIILFE